MASKILQLKVQHHCWKQLQLVNSARSVEGIKKFSAQAEAKPKNEATISLEEARPFESIPGPGKFELVRSFLPGGEFYKKSMTVLLRSLRDKYGPLYVLPGLFGRDCFVIAMNPDDYPIIFRNEGIWPNRKGFETVLYHRQVHRSDFFEGIEGVVASNGESWAKVRTLVNPVLMQPKNASLYFTILREVNDEFLKRIYEIRDPKTFEVPSDFIDEINRLTFESVAAVALNTKLGLIRKNRDSEESKTIISSIRRLFELSESLEIQPSLWKWVKTPQFKEMMKVQDTLTDICSKYINEALVRIERDSEAQASSQPGKAKSVLEKLARIDKKIAIVMALDMMLAGVDTTSSTLSGILLCLAKNPDKQEKVFQELYQKLPQRDSPLQLEHMQNLPYLRACIKEAMRVYPILPGTVRKLPVDVVLSGYRVPAGVDISIASNLLIQDEKYVPLAKEFIPERWLRDDHSSKGLEGQLSNPFMYLPFGFGPRSCAGKRIVNMEMELTIARLVRNFHIEYNYPVENAFTTQFISVPAIPLKFKFEERKK